ncbi:hypothetical protein BH10PSE3_BH10PSE3_22840 [soil metagenome]
MKKSSLSRLIIVGLLVAAPAAAFAQQSPSSEPAARDGRTYTGGRHHPDPAPATVTPPPAPVAKGINQAGIKKTEDAPAAALVTPPAEAGKGHSEKGIK